MSSLRPTGWTRSTTPSKEDQRLMSPVDRAMAEIEDKGDEEELQEEATPAPPPPQLAATADKVYDSLVQLKAYAVSVYGKTYDVDTAQQDKGSSIVPFLKRFGQDPKVGTKTKTGGIIAEYAELMAQEKAKYTTGLGLYMLTKMNAAILEGRNLLDYVKVGD